MIMNMPETPRYYAKDLYLAAFIYSQDIKLLDVRKDISDNFLWFVFENSKQCKQLEDKFWSKEATVELNSYLSALKTLKQRLFQNSTGG